MVMVKINNNKSLKLLSKYDRWHIEFYVAPDERFKNLILRSMSPIGTTVNLSAYFDPKDVDVLSAEPFVAHVSGFSKLKCIGTGLSDDLEVFLDLNNKAPAIIVNVDTANEDRALIDGFEIRVALKCDEYRQIMPRNDAPVMSRTKRT
jgi:hypothetical protein